MVNAQTLHQLFEVQAAKYPHQVAVLFENQVLTYEQLNQKANQLAHYLIHEGVTPDTLIGLYFERSIDFLIAVFGVLKAGGAYIPLDTTYPYERAALILKNANNPLVITTHSLAKKMTSYAGTLLVLNNNNQIDMHPTENPSALVTAENLAYVIYTSGSTGTPKGVLIEHGALVNYCLWFSQLYHPLSKVDFSANHAFDMAISLYLTPLALGVSVVMCNDFIKKDPRNYLKYLRANDIDFIKLTPSYFKLLVNEVQKKPIKLPRLKKIMLGGENLSKIDCEAWLSQYPQHVLYNEYGPTEATVAVTAFAVNKDTITSMGESIPIGTLATNTYAYLLDKELKPVAANEVGELYVGGMCLARGYLNSPELSEKYFIKDPFSKGYNARIYKTGDLCRRLPGDILECLGRIDFQIKIRGFRVEPDEIENQLAKHPALQSVAVIASNHLKEKSLVAYYILKNPDTTLEVRELSHYLERFLPDYMIPTAFIRMDNFPLNANDKLDRSALPIPQFSTNQYYLAAKSRLEKKLAKIWSEEFGFNPIGVNDDFFELGGHSLSAARILSKINHELKIELSLQEFYSSATIAGLIPLIKKAKKCEKRQTRLTKKLNHDSALLPLSDFQFMLWIADAFEPKAKKLNIFTRKRFSGRLDLQRLNAAFSALLHQHEVLSYHVSRIRPAQYLTNNTPFTIIEHSLESLPDAQKEAVLQESVQELIHYSSWPSNSPPIIIRLFYLTKECSELQLCVPHIISDDLTPDILLSDLSEHYHCKAKNTKKPTKDRAYRHYLLEEQLYLKKHSDRDRQFWEDYLKDAQLYPFPSHCVVKDMKAQNYSYSTYLDIPGQHLVSLLSFCAKNHISILDGLCAVVALALKNCTQTSGHLTYCINRVKSTRENRDYDKTIGCFLRIEPIKLTVNENDTLSELSQAIHQSALTTNPYQACPNLIKLASIGSFRKQKNRLKATFSKLFFWIYSLMFQAQRYYPSLRILERLNTTKGDTFLININVQSNFFTTHQTESDEGIFGFATQTIPKHQFDLLEIDNLFDVNFLRTPDSDQYFLVISANLKPDFREAIGHEMIRILSHELTHQGSKKDVIKPALELSS